MIHKVLSQEVININLGPTTQLVPQGICQLLELKISYDTYQSHFILKLKLKNPELSNDTTQTYDS